MGVFIKQSNNTFDDSGKSKVKPLLDLYVKLGDCQTIESIKEVFQIIIHQNNIRLDRISVESVQYFTDRIENIFISYPEDYKIFNTNPYFVTKFRELVSNVLSMCKTNMEYQYIEEHREFNKGGTDSRN